jgi:hypothetical protein
MNHLFPSTPSSELLAEKDSLLLGAHPPATVECIYDFARYAWGRGESVELRQPTEPQIEAFASIGVTPAMFAAFSCFVGHPFDYCIRFNRADSGWRSAKIGVSLTHYQLLGHLKGDRWIATGARWNPSIGLRGRHQTRSFVIDLDFGSDLLDRFDTVSSLLGIPSLLFRSSHSGGLHAWYFLESAVDLFRLKDKQGTGGAVAKLLRGGGIAERSGAVEIYPAGKLRNGPRGNRLRLPFGAESCLLDPTAPTKRLTGGNHLDDLRRVTQLFAEKEVTVHSFERLFERARSVPVEYPIVRSAKKNGRATTSRKESVPAVLNTGITQAGRLNRSLSEVAYYFRRNGASETECSERVVEWLSTSHNGQSRTFNQSALAAYAEARRVVASIYAKYGMPRQSRELPPVTAGELSRLFHATAGDLSQCDPSTGEVLGELKRFRLQDFLFTANRLHKDYVFREARLAFFRIASRHPQLDFGAPEFMERFRDQLAPVWPSPELPRFQVPFPSTLRRQIKGVTGVNHTAYWNAAKESGLYQLTRKAIPRVCCELYAVWLDFDEVALCEGFTNLAVALPAVQSWAELKDAYEPSYLRRIRRAAMQLPTKPALRLSTAESLIVTWASGSKRIAA